MNAEVTAGADNLDDARPQRVRKPLYTAPTPAGAACLYADDPAPLVEARYRRIWETSMRDMSFVNGALSVAAIGFRRYRGDWVGAVITPWFLNLFLLPGGGTLWSDLASGDRVRIPFPVGELEFIADFDPGGDIPAYQYCPLFAPVSQFATQAAALAAAEEALSALFAVLEPVVVEGAAEAAAPAAEAPIPPRRAFLRKVVGHRS
jgi:[NiFe] hydrogenase assembly HybE family chaperone